MRALLVTAICVLFAAAGFARTQELRQAVSPDGRYTVKAVESGTPLRISYDIVSVRTGARLHRFSSSYQPEKGAGDWDWEHTIDAEVSWSPDSRYVALDEQVHRNMGEVLLAEVGENTRGIPMPEKAVIKRTQLDWDRYRIRLRDGWRAPQDLSLSIAGQVSTGVRADGRTALRRLQVNFILRFSGGRARIVGVDDPDDA
jgi:hypothetical protein